MPSRRDAIVIAATVLADTAWLYPILGMIGYAIGQGGSPLPLPVVFALIAFGLVVSRTIAMAAPNPGGPAAVQALLGLVVIYLAMAVATEDFLWGPRMIGGGFPGQVLAGVIVGTAMAVCLWFRGVRIGGETHPQVRLLIAFRTGIVGLAIAVLAEQGYDADFAATTMLVPFFAVSLAGLAFARMQSTVNWSRLVGLVVAAVIGGGFLIGAIGAVFGGSGLRLLAVVWGHFLDAIAWLLSLVLVPVLEVVFDFFIWLFGESVAKPGAERVIGLREPSWWDKVEPDSLSPIMELVVQVMKYPLLLFVIYLIYRLLLWAYRAYTGRVAAAAAVDRESIRGQANAAADLVNLALGLLPDWMIPGAGRREFRAPEGRPGITEAFALYFDTLKAAGKRGFTFVSSMTPNERISDLKHAVPGAPVEQITDTFNGACYGNIPVDSRTIERLRQDLDSEETAR